MTHVSSLCFGVEVAGRKREEHVNLHIVSAKGDDFNSPWGRNALFLRFYDRASPYDLGLDMRAIFCNLSWKIQNPFFLFKDGKQRRV
jgi:hypothetical protein